MVESLEVSRSASHGRQEAKRDKQEEVGASVFPRHSPTFNVELTEQCAGQHLCHMHVWF